MDNQLTEHQQWWPSPAKLNLFLHITGRRPNGYHNLQSLFQLLDFGDALKFTLTTSQDIELRTPIEGVKNADNLIIRAANLLAGYRKVKHGVVIDLDKQLPMGGGIGGGSSNAATTLVALNKLWQCELSEDTLADIGLSLGADVPIFVRGHTAFASGVGEQLTPVKTPPKWFLVVNPGVHVSTADVFNLPELPRETAEIAWQDYSFANTHNDCQQIVCNRYPEVAKLLQWLVHYAPSRMTGTGACVFSVFDDQASAERVRAQLPKKWHGFVARGVDVSPLKTTIKRVTM